MTVATEILEVQVDEVMRLIREREEMRHQRDQARDLVIALWDENVLLQATIADRDLQS